MVVSATVTYAGGVFPLTTGANTPLPLKQLALCSGDILSMYITPLLDFYALTTLLTNVILINVRNVHCCVCVFLAWRACSGLWSTDRAMPSSRLQMGWLQCMLPLRLASWTACGGWWRWPASPRASSPGTEPHQCTLQLLVAR